jgi:polyhydroxyalkanoate synthesis regulator phasin
MAQGRSSGSRSKPKSSSSAKAKSTRAKSASAKSTSAKSTRAKSSASRSAASRSASSSRSAASRKAAASKGGKTRARQQKARKAASGTAKTAARGARGAGVEAKTVAELREALRKNLIRPMEMVMLSRERIEEVLGEAVDQGRVTARDAQRITSGLVKRGQRQTNDVLKDLEGLLDRGRSGVESRTSGARGRAVRRASPALAQVDRVRRTAGVGASFPITGYDDLTASQIQGRLGTLTPAELRKVRDHERRSGKRKTVLQSIESKLS